MACEYIVSPEPSSVVRLILCYRFRWAACQLPTLENCLDLPMLEKRLATLPSTLAETYSQILGNIPDDYRPNAIKILQFLTYSEYPISLEEAVDIIATDPMQDPSFQVRNRMRKANETLLLCSSLVSPVTRILTERSAKTKKRIEIHLAHFSVKEYFRSGTSELEFSQQLKEDAARASIVQVSLAYLSSLKLGWELERIRLDYPFAELSATIWESSAAAAESNKGAKDMIVKFFANDSRGYANWSRLRSRVDSGRQVRLYHVAFLELYQTMEVLLQSDDHDPIKALDFRITLDMVTRAGKPRLVELLLQHQQRFYDVSQDESFLSALDGALREASSLGYERIVKILVHQGADVDAQGGDYDSPLQAAAYKSHERILRLLLDAGADVNARAGLYGIALLAAALGDRHQVVQILLARGADTSFKDETYGTALRVACIRNHAEIPGRLLEADVGDNNLGDSYPMPFYAAVTAGHDKIVQTLLSRGARLTTKSLWGTPRNLITVEPLILSYITKDLIFERDARRTGTLLHWAVGLGDQALTDRCLKLGAEVDATDVHGRSALHYAADKGRYEIVKRLIRANADRTIVNSDGLTALDCAHDRLGTSYPDIVAYLEQWAGAMKPG
jgi:ankyrin repeat protein